MEVNHFLGQDSWFFTHKHLEIFLLLFFFGGATTTSLAAFWAKLGLFDVWAVFGLATLASFTRNLAYYWLGAFGAPLIGKYGPRFGISRERLDSIGECYRRHPIFTVFVVKNAPFLAFPGLTAAGAIGMPFKRYVFWITVNIVPIALLWTGTGYCAGAAYLKAAATERCVLGAVAAGLLLAAWGYRKFFASAAHRIVAAGKT